MCQNVAGKMRDSLHIRVYRKDNLPLDNDDQLNFEFGLAPYMLRTSKQGILGNIKAQA